jgi:hypothetical protein
LWSASFTGGNRTLKIDSITQDETLYYYDPENPGYSGSKNNRLMYEELFNSSTVDGMVD